MYSEKFVLYNKKKKLSNAKKRIQWKFVKICTLPVTVNTEKTRYLQLYKTELKWENREMVIYVKLFPFFH